ncbi:MAG: hypothetical protein JSS02_26830 [Planctomycetes bacterium]|nr:hypothetical protein [Planctomycetota bacterium]
MTELPINDGRDVEIDSSLGESTDAVDTGRCPMCGAEEHREARVCRNCGERLEGRHGFSGGPEHRYWRSGDLLVLERDARLPAVCVLTNGATSERARRQLYWHPGWVYLTLICPPLYLFVVLFTQKTADIEFGLSRERQVQARSVTALAVLAAIFGLVMICTPISPWANPDVPGLLLEVGGVALLLAAVVARELVTRAVSAARITARYVWLKGVHSDYLAGLSEFPGESQAPSRGRV